TIYEGKVRKLVNPKVLDLLNKVSVDYLGVSLDALLIYCSERASKKIIDDLEKNNIRCAEIGFVDDSKQVSMIFKGQQKKEILPRFRESAYTKIKKEIGEDAPANLDIMQTKVEEAALNAIQKRKLIIDYIQNKKS
ncbi:MAG TPA: hypothetical protein VGB37_13170, partial [Candidatus Lokiarchaeia archaeon]